MWTRWHPFRTLRQILHLWARQVTALEQANRLASLQLSTTPVPITAEDVSRLVHDCRNTWQQKPSANNAPSPTSPRKKLDARSVVYVTRSARIARQMRARGQTLHGAPPNVPSSAPTTNPPPSDATDAD